MKFLFILLFSSLLFIGCSDDESTNPDEKKLVNDTFITGKWKLNLIEFKDTVNADMDLTGRDTTFTGAGKSYLHIIWDESSSSYFKGDVTAEGTYSQAKISVTFANGMKFSGIRNTGASDKTFIGDLTVQNWTMKKTYPNVAFTKSE